MAEGDLTVEVPVERRDEIGQLALSVQGMVRRLRAAHERVEVAECAGQAVLGGGRLPRPADAPDP